MGKETKWFFFSPVRVFAIRGDSEEREALTVKRLFFLSKGLTGWFEPVIVNQ